MTTNTPMGLKEAAEALLKVLGPNQDARVWDAMEQLRFAAATPTPSDAEMREELEAAGIDVDGCLDRLGALIARESAKARAATPTQDDWTCQDCGKDVVDRWGAEVHEAEGCPETPTPEQPAINDRIKTSSVRAWCETPVEEVWRDRAREVFRDVEIEPGDLRDDQIEGLATALRGYARTPEQPDTRGLECNNCSLWPELAAAWPDAKAGDRCPATYLDDHDCDGTLVPSEQETCPYRFDGGEGCQLDSGHYSPHQWEDAGKPTGYFAAATPTPEQPDTDALKVAVELSDQVRFYTLSPDRAGVLRRAGESLVASALTAAADKAHALGLQGRGLDGKLLPAPPFTQEDRGQ